MQSDEKPHAAGIGGGSGFSVSTTVPNIAAQLPALLRDIAAQMEAAMEQTKGN